MQEDLLKLLVRYLKQQTGKMTVLKKLLWKAQEHFSVLQS